MATKTFVQWSKHYVNRGGSARISFPIAFSISVYGAGSTMSDYLGRTDVYADTNQWFMRTNSSEYGMTSWFIVIGI